MVRGKAAKGRAAEDGLEEHVEGDAAPAAGQYRKAVDSKLGWDPHYTPGLQALLRAWQACSQKSTGFCFHSNTGGGG